MSGRKVLFGALLFIVSATVGLFFAFRSAALHRFAIGVYSFGETPDLRPKKRLWFIDLSQKQRISKRKPIVVWIEGGTAGKTSLRGLVYLFSHTGVVYSAPQEMVTKPNYHNQVIEEALFSEPEELRQGNVLGVLVMRLPSITDELKQSFLEQTKDVTGQMDRIARMKLLCTRAGGFAEFALVHIAKE